MTKTSTRKKGFLSSQGKTEATNERCPCCGTDLQGRPQTVFELIGNFACLVLLALIVVFTWQATSKFVDVWFGHFRESVVFPENLERVP